MQLLPQSSVADGVVEVLTKGGLEFFKIDVFSRAVRLYDQTSDKKPNGIENEATKCHLFVIIEQI